MSLGSRSGARAALIGSMALATVAHPATTVISGGPILDESGQRWLTAHAVIVESGRITDVRPVAQVELEPGVDHVDLAGAYLIPGLIDLHTHLLLHPYDEASWSDQVLRESLGERAARAVTAANRTLQAGFTTIRDLGTEGAGYVDVGLATAVRKGVISGPAIVTTTRAIVATGAYGPAGWDPRWSMPVAAEVADGAVGVRLAVRRQVAAGADWIKVYADGRRRAAGPVTPTFTLEELRVIVEEAAAAGLPVAAHATTDEAIRRAVEAGVRTIEHGTGASEVTLALMSRRGVMLCPTLAAAEAIDTYSGNDGLRLRAATAMVRRAMKAEVNIGMGSDAGVFTHGDNARELELLVDAGMTPQWALRAATSGAATVLGRGATLGRIAPEAVADLVALRRDPLETVTALRDPVLVIKDGRIVADLRTQPTDEDREELLARANTLFECLREGDFDRFRTLCEPGALIAIDRQAAGAQSTITVESFIERSIDRYGPDNEFREWISAEPTIMIDGSIAVVWAPFIVESNGHRAAGTDVFQFLKREGTWRFTALSFTNRGL